MKKNYFVCISADGNPLAHSVLRNSLPEDFSTAELQAVSLCKNKAASEEPYSRGTVQQSE